MSRMKFGGGNSYGKRKRGGKTSARRHLIKKTKAYLTADLASS